MPSEMRRAPGSLLLAVAAALWAGLWSAADARAAEDRPGTVAAAARALESRIPADRAAAADFLGSRKDRSDRAAAVVALIPRLDDPEATVRRSVVNALSRLAERAVAPCLRKRLSAETDADVLASLLVATGALGGPEDVDRLVPYLRDGRPTVRAAALTGLGDLGGERARQAVLGALERPALPEWTAAAWGDVEWNVASAAVLALARCGRPEDVGRALAVVREHDGWRHWFARSAVARLVAALDPDPLPALRRLLEDADARVVTTAVEGIARRAPSEEVGGLLGNERPGVRAAAATAVGRVPVLPLVPRVRTLARLDPSRPVRWAAARALFRLGDSLGDDLVLEAVDAKEPAVWTEAVALLAETTGADHGRDVAAWRTALARSRRGS